MTNQTATGDRICPHGLPVQNCSACAACQPYYMWPLQHPSVAGHCGKCGAPYTADVAFSTGFGPPKFLPSCKCWNT